MESERKDGLARTIDEIDRQHRELVERVTHLVHACDHGNGEQEVGRLLGYLQERVVPNFTIEEKYMARCSYPGYAAHRKEHELFVERCAGLKERFSSEGGSPWVVLEAIRMTADWVVCHIRTTDEAMRAFLVKRDLPAIRRSPLQDAYATGPSAV